MLAKANSAKSVPVSYCLQLMSDPLSLFDRLMAVKPVSLSVNAWTVRAGLSRSALQDIKRRGNASWDTIQKLLDAIGVTQAEFEAGARQTEKEPSTDAVRAPYQAFRGQDRPRDIPVVGTAQCADIEFTTDGEPVAIETMEMDMGEVVDYVRRPASLDNRRDIYAIYFVGGSLEPRYEAGEIAYVDPRRAPSVGSYVVVQLRRPDETEGERVHVVLAKRLNKVTATHYELEQFNPPARFRVERERVKHIHRIIPWHELVAF